MLKETYTYEQQTRCACEEERDAYVPQTAYVYMYDNVQGISVQSKTPKNACI